MEFKFIIKMSLFGNGLYDVIAVLRDIATHLSNQTNALLGIAYNASEDLYTVTGRMLFQKRVYINTDIEFADSTIQSTAFTNELKTVIANNTADILTNEINTGNNTSAISSNVTNIGILDGRINDNVADIADLYAEVHNSFSMICTVPDSSIDNLLSRSPHVNTHTFFHQCVEFSANNAYRNYSIGLLGDNTTNNNQFCIAGVGGGGNDPNIIAAFDDGGNAYFANNLYLDHNLECNRITLDENLYVNGDIDLATSGKKIIYPDNSEQTTAFNAEYVERLDQFTYDTFNGVTTCSADFNIDTDKYLILSNGSASNSRIVFPDSTEQSSAFTSSHKTLVESLSTLTLDTTDVWLAQVYLDINDTTGPLALNPNPPAPHVYLYANQYQSETYTINSGHLDAIPVYNSVTSGSFSAFINQDGTIKQEGLYSINFKSALDGCNYINRLQNEIRVYENNNIQLPNEITGMRHDGNNSDWSFYGVEITRYIRITSALLNRIKFDLFCYYAMATHATPTITFQVTITRYPQTYYK